MFVEHVNMVNIIKCPHDLKCFASSITCTGQLTTVTVLALFSQGLQERLMVLFPQDVLLLSVDSKRLNIRYEVV